MRRAAVAGRRRLKRHSSLGDVPVEVGKVTCIRGRWHKDWRVLPVITVSGVECASISPRKPWLHQLLGGAQLRSEFVDAIANFMDECRAAACSRAGATDPPASSQEGQQDVAKGRAAILGDSDDDEPTPQRPAATQDRRRGKPRGDFVNVQVSGMEITVAAGMGNRRVLVPTTDTMLEQLIGHLQGRRGEARHRPRATGDRRDPQARRLLDLAVAPQIHLTEQDSRRVCWCADGNWRISYMDKQGKMRRTSRGLHVPVKSLSGIPYTVAQFESASKDVLCRARELWDRLDESTGPRYAGQSGSDS